MKASVFIATTLDGYIARENGSLDWLPGAEGEIDISSEPDNNSDNEDFGYNVFMDHIDVLVMGRNTYEFVLSSGQWPYGNKRVIVLSSTINRVSDNISGTVEIRSGSPDEIYLELKLAGAKHLYIDGGKTIQEFLNSGLIDEIIITTVPVLIGKSIPLFGVLNEDKKLELLETKHYSNGFVQSKYAVLD